MSKLYLCSENHSVLGTMETYENLRQQPTGADNKSHPARRPLPANTDHYGKAENFGKPSQWSNLDTEKGFNARFGSVQDLSDEPIRPADSSEALNRVRTANAVTMTPELFEKLYLNPHQKVTGDLRTTFGNPTPIGLLGFLLAGSPLACEMMGWRGAGGGGIAMVAVYYFVGGFLMSLGGLLEFFLGNTFSFIVFLGYGKMTPWLREKCIRLNVDQEASGFRWAAHSHLRSMRMVLMFLIRMAIPMQAWTVHSSMPRMASTCSSWH